MLALAMVLPQQDGGCRIRNGTGVVEGAQEAATECRMEHGSKEERGEAASARHNTAAAAQGVAEESEGDREQGAD